MSALARLASTCMSGCLIFHRPVICSTTSFESSRTWTDAEGSRSQRGLQARDQAVVLGDVVARDADVHSDLAQHVAGGVIEDDRSPGGDSGIAARAPVGFDDQPAGHRPDSSVRTRMHPHSGQVITASSAAPGGRLQIGAGEDHPTALARAAPQQRGAGAACGDAVVVGRAGRRAMLPATAARSRVAASKAAVASATTRLASALSSEPSVLVSSISGLLLGDCRVGLLRAAP